LGYARSTVALETQLRSSDPTLVEFSVKDRFDSQISSFRNITLFCAALASACGESGDDSGSGATGGTSGSAGTAMSGDGGTMAGTSGSGGASGDAGASSGTAGAEASGGAGAGGTAGDAGSAGTAGDAGSAGAGGAAGTGGAPTWGIETRPTGQTCVRPATEAAMPALLSATGCVDPLDPTRPAAGMIPYTVASPLWSDGAAKQRYFALPDGETIHVKNCDVEPETCAPPEEGGTYEDEGDWDFPVGSVLMKTFSLGDRLVETRLLVRVGEFDWWGFSYEWLPDQSDAQLLAQNTDGYDREVTVDGATQTWHFPSRQQCLQCHTTAAGVALGPETSQLNVDFTYPNGVTGNQLETLEHAGFFDAAPPARAPYPDPFGTGTEEERARSYLHTNCAICHRPGSNFTGFDLRYTTEFADTNLCNVPPEKGNLGVTDAMKLVPGDPALSLISLRMHSTDPMTRMPQIGVRVVDESATEVVDAWIGGLTTCP
jgi:uncharacterized repeat protein (TIGR03806 family)